MASSNPDMGYTRVYDPGEDRTRVWDKNGFKGYEGGNTEKFGSNLGPVDSDPTGLGGSQSPLVKDSKGNVDLPSTINNIGQMAIPVAAQLALPEIPGVGKMLSELSPAMQVMSKMGASTAGGTALDQLMSFIKGGDQPLINSVAKGGVNALTGIGLPELLNVGPTLNPITRRTISSAEPTISETSGTTSSSGTSNRSTTGYNDVIGNGISKNLSHSDAVKLGFQPTDSVTETITRDPDSGQYVKAYKVTKDVPREGQYQTNTTVDSNGSSEYDRISKAVFGSESAGTTSNQSTRQGTTVTTPGVRTTDSEKIPTGMWGQIAQFLKGVGSKQYPSTPITGNGPVTTSALGLLANLLKNGNPVVNQQK